MRSEMLLDVHKMQYVFSTGSDWPLEGDVRRTPLMYATFVDICLPYDLWDARTEEVQASRPRGVAHPA